MQCLVSIVYLRLYMYGTSRNGVQSTRTYDTVAQTTIRPRLERRYDGRCRRKRGWPHGTRHLKLLTRAQREALSRWARQARLTGETTLQLPDRDQRFWAASFSSLRCPARMPGRA